MVIGTFCINTKSVKVPFDSGASCSFVSKSRVKDLELENPEETSFSVANPSGETFHCNTLFREMSVKIGKVKFSSDLFSLEMDDLNVILALVEKNVFTAHFLLRFLCISSKK